MLRLKLALDECGIKQKSLCDATGFGKTQVSLTLSTGKLPANAEKFRNGAQSLVEANLCLVEWLARNNMTTWDLFETIINPDQGGPETAPLPLPTPATLPRLLCDIAGRAVLNDGDEFAVEIIIQLARTCSYLHREMSILVGHDAPWMVRTEAEAAAILTGGQA